MNHHRPINSFGWQPHSRAFRVMLRVMGSAPVRELDVWTGWLPRARTTRFGARRNWERETRRTYRKAMNHRDRRSFHHYLRSARGHDYTAVTSMRRLPLPTRQES